MGVLNRTMTKENTMRTNRISKKVTMASIQNIKERDYWLDKLSGEFMKSTFPYDFQRKGKTGRIMEKENFLVKGELFDGLMRLSNQSDVRLYITLITTMVLLLSRYSGNKDVLVGAPIYRQEVEGEFINTVVTIRNQLEELHTFKQLLLQMGQKVFEANENQNYPIETLLYKLDLPFDGGDFPLFDLAILLENIHEKEYLSGVQLNMMVSFKQEKEFIETEIEYNSLLYRKTTITRIRNNFLHLLSQVLFDIDTPMKKVNILSDIEKQTLLEKFNQGAVTFDQQHTVYHLVEKFAEQEPDSVAFEFEGETLSYSQVNIRANRLARKLRNKGIDKNQLVGISMNRTLSMAESILAVWKAGGAYIPIEPDYPVQRIQEIISDSESRAFITQAEYISEDLEKAVLPEIILLDQENLGDPPSEAANANPDLDFDNSSLTYVIYTSGSTGKPKGVMVEHIGMMNHLYAKINDLQVDKESIIAQNASHTFDISIWQFFTALLKGGKTIIYSDYLILEPERFITQLIEDGVTILEVVPSYLAVMLDSWEPHQQPKQLTSLLVTGEAVKGDLVRKWFRKHPGIKMVNAYGPTEASDDITHHIMESAPSQDMIPIGKPLQNFHIYIVDENFNLCPMGVKGEICVSGIGVGRGYLKDKEKTEKVFMRDPFITEKEVSLYKTGDIGRWLEDGAIEFFGRKDHQVKIRGFRIELGEIESKLVSHEDVEEAVVIDREDEEGNKNLCAYLVTNKPLNVSRIKNYLSDILPEYMVPAYFVKLKEIPLTPNGKTDRKALPEPSIYLIEYLPYVTEEMLTEVSSQPEEKRREKEEKDIEWVGQVELTSEQKEQVLTTFNNTHTRYPKEKTIQEVFQDQEAETPSWFATGCGDDQLTFQELNQRANQLARVLRAKGIQPETIVALLMENSVEMIMGILAILKAGGAYLPIGPTYPEERKTYMLKDSGAQMLLTNIVTLSLKNRIPVLNVHQKNDIDEADTNLESLNTSSSLAHIFYTSGTTGTPKGSVNVHQNVINFAQGIQDRILSKYHKGLRICLVAPYVFDAFVQQAFGAILFGHSLIYLPDEARFDGEQLLELYQKFQVEISDGTPTHICLLLEALKGKKTRISVRNFIIAGEILQKKVVENFFDCFEKKVPEITNAYGPTECCGDSSLFPVTRENVGDWEKIPIGTPMPNEQVYILGKNHDLLPPEVTGELFISGDGVARGYLNRPELSHDTYVPNPFEQGKTMYRTGDLAQWLPDGNIHFIGRIDHQVQIMGIRIELAEVENSLLKFTGIKEAVVVVKETTDEDTYDEKYLCAFIVSDNRLIRQELRDHLLNELPDYMVPSYFVQAEKLPLTHNGKVNRKLLERVEVSTGTDVDYVAPRDKTEEALVEIWSDVLNINKDKISIDSSFFDMGGHSLKAIIMVARIHKELKVKIQLIDMFETPNIKGLAQLIRGAGKEEYVSINPVEKKDFYPLSSAQKRLYFLQQMQPDTTSYNSSTVALLRGQIDIRGIEEAFNQLIERHETLSTSFELVDKEIVQRVNPDIRLKIEYQEAAEEEAQELIKKFMRPFDLAQAPLLRLGLIKVGEERHILMKDLHHIITDGLSTGIFLKDLMALINGDELPGLKLSYRDYSEWQNSELGKHEMKKQENYWLEIFSGEVPLMELPTDFDRPELVDFEGSSRGFSLGEEETKALKQLAVDEDATLFIVMLTIFNVLLAKLSGQEDIVIGTPIEGRKHDDLNQIIGMFVNSLPLRNKPEGSKGFKDFLREVRERTLKAYDHQEYQFDDLLDKISFKRDPRRNPLFDVFFSLLNIEIPRVEVTGLKLNSYRFERKITKFDLSMVVAEAKDKLSFTITYSTRLFKEETIDRFIAYFKNIIHSVIKDMDQKIQDLEVIGKQELNDLIVKARKEQEKSFIENMEEKSNENQEIEADFEF
jgi:amino acid adenylation domain-containing protein